MDFFTEWVCRMCEEEWRTFIVVVVVVAFPDWVGELGSWGGWSIGRFLWGGELRWIFWFGWYYIGVNLGYL